MQKLLSALIVFTVLFSGLSFGEILNTRMSTSTLKDTPYSPGEVFFEVAKPSILRVDSEGAPDVTLQRNEYIQCRYLGLSGNILEVEIVEVTEQAALNHTTGEWEEELALKDEDKRSVRIPLNRDNKGLFRLIKNFTTSSSMIKDFDSAPRRQYMKQFLITVVDDSGRIKVEEYAPEG